MRSLLILSLCALLLEKISTAESFSQAEFLLEYHAGEMDPCEVDYVASQIILSKKWPISDRDKLGFLKFWEKVRAK